MVVQSQPWANNSQDPILKEPITKKELMEWLKPQYCKKKKTRSSEV
jgi:hypothetical protein